MLPISIIIPCFNYGKYISDTLASVEKDISTEDEVIIVDDGSKDDTREVVSEWIQDKSNFRYVYQENQGPGPARNAGLDLSKTDYAYFLDADDCPLPGKLEVLKEAATQNPDAAMVIGSHMTYDSTGKEKHHRVGTLSDSTKENFVEYTIKKNFGIANGGCVLLKTAIARKYRYPPTLRLGDDLSLYSWILANHACVTVDATIIAIRKHTDSLRHQIDLYEESVPLLPEVLFNPEFLDKELFVYKSDFEHHLQLSLSRAQFRAGHNKAARKTYLNAIKARPGTLLDWSYLSKFLRSFGKN